MRFEKTCKVQIEKNGRKALPRIKELKNTWLNMNAHGAAAAQKQQIPPPTFDNTSLFG